MTIANVLSNDQASFSDITISLSQLIDFFLQHSEIGCFPSLIFPISFVMDMILGLSLFLSMTLRPPLYSFHFLNLT